ncbi:hybrid sensor histidine kinase/response regulator [Burkholderia gladioli]|uniref:hybrid sensor histidine kinase/response regulator n=1 Tax=Burkholderia gladioli TaxID=28095 RepID=UPI001641369B|nr:hybrid sensor histidine kinase/response regulator [Burkholderia gladioli]MBU9197941.1 hybrid sensor histidine kinase/response regulator [Burkholderia gladioli]
MRPPHVVWRPLALALPLCSLFPLLALVLLMTHPASIEAGESGPAVEVIDLARLAPQLPLTRQLALLEDPGGRLDAAAALASPNWQPATPAALTRGYSASAFWLTGTLENSGRQEVTRWLSVAVVRLEDVRYFRFAPGDDRPRETVLAGNREPLLGRPVKTALSVFPITLAPGERMRFALRIQSRSSISMAADLWTPGAFRDNEQQGAMGEMLLVGSLLTITVYALCLGFSRRDPVFLLLAGTVLSDIAYDLAFRGYLYRYVLVDGGEWVLRAPSIAGAITTALFSAMAMAYAELERIPYWKWIYRALIALQCLFGLWCAFGDYRVSANLALDSIVLCNLVWIVSMLDGWRRGHANARLFLLAFAIDCATLFLRLAFLYGILPERWGAGIAWDNLSVLLMMILTVSGRAMHLERQQQRAQQALLDERAREQERLERAVGERTEALHTALIAAGEANRAKTDFLARVSHDLRTPLTSIIGFADLVQAGGREDAARGGIIRRSATHMLHMVNDLIDFAAGRDTDALHPAPVYTHALLDALSNEAQSLAGKAGLRFVLDLRNEVPPILELDDKRIRQIVGNLVDNAIKFTRAGTVTLSVDCRSEPPATAAVALMIAVSDTGCGIAAEAQSRIFEPFHRLDAARSLPGIGLGLAIVKHWVSRMNGMLTLDSTPGLGTTITLTIPSRIVPEADAARHHLSDTAGVLPSIAGNGLRIWVAEDAAEIRQFLDDELSNLGFEVETMPDGAALIQRVIGARGPRPDLVLTDHTMPRAGGAAVLAAVRQHFPTAPVVVLSALPQAVEETRGSGDAAGYDACLLKPVNLPELHNTLARLLGLARESTAGPPQGEEAPLVRPSMHALAEARQLIGLGAITDLADWADGLAARDRRCATFALKVQQLARLGELGELRVLLEK